MISRCFFGKFKQKIINILSVLVFFTNIINTNIKAVTRVLPLGKSVLISSKNYSDISWSSDNPDVAVIDNNGILSSCSVGKACITGTDIDNNKIFEHNFEITEQEPIKFVHVDLPKDNHDSINFSAIVNSKSDIVKFEINSQDCKHKIYVNTKKNSNNIWAVCTKKLGNIGPGEYTLTVYCKINNKWLTCKDASLKFKIQDIESSLKLSCQEKQLSDAGVNFISRVEGFRSSTYKDISGKITIGFGEMIFPERAFYNNLTREEALVSLKKKCADYVKAVNNFLTKNKIKFNQNQFDALVSYTYNNGTAWLRSSSSYLRELILQAGDKNNKIYGHVNSDSGLNLRKSPDVNSQSLKILDYNSKVKILDSQKINQNWYHVEFKDPKNHKKTSGYCHGKYLNLNEEFKNRSLNLINKEEFTKEFLSRHHVDGKCSVGILNRRMMELDIFFDNLYSIRPNYSKYPMPECIKL